MEFLSPERVKSIVGGSSEIIKKPAMQDDPKKRKPDITRAKKYLNWSPQVCSNLFSGETFLFVPLTHYSIGYF